MRQLARENPTNSINFAHVHSNVDSGMTNVDQKDCDLRLGCDRITKIPIILPKTVQFEVLQGSEKTVWA